MTKNTKLGAVALLVGLALTLGACGSKGGKTGPAGSTDTAQVTFQSDPVAEIWIDGKASGNTPAVLSLSAGSHEVSLKRAGFQDLNDTITVDGGKAITVDGTLPVAGSDVAALRRLTAMLGEKHEPFAEPSTSRSVGDAVTLYYPMGDVRRAGLGTYRIEVDPSYDYKGFIEFRKGKKVLHRAKFEPEALITENALPAEVLEAARNGTTLSWGLAYDNKRRKRDEKLVKFKVIPKSREKTVAKKLAKTTSRKAYKTASPLLQEMAEIEELKRYRLYSEVLVRSLAVLNGWEETTLPYDNMVDVMARLKLKESGLYKFAASQVSGGGGMRLLKGGQSGVTDKNRDKTKGGGQAGGMGNTASGTAIAPSRLPRIAIAPPSKRSGKTGMQAGGLGVKPTDTGAAAAGAAAPAGSTPGAATGGDSTNPLLTQRNDLDRQLEELKDQLREADLRAAVHADALENLENIQREIENMGDAIGAAEKAAADAQAAAATAAQTLKDLETSGSASDSDLEAASAAAQAAREAAEQASEGAERAKQRLKGLEQDRKDLEGELRRVERQEGVGEAAQEAEKLREQITEVERQVRKTDKQLEQAGVQGPGKARRAARDSSEPSTPGPGDGTPGSGTPGAGDNATGQPVDPRAAMRAALEQARSELEAAQGILDAAATDRATALAGVESAHSERDATQTAYDAIANGTLPAAEQALDAKSGELDTLVANNASQSDIDAATAAVTAAANSLEAIRSEFHQAEAAHNAAEANAARAEMELTRLDAAALRAEQDKQAAEAEIKNLSK